MINIFYDFYKKKRLIYSMKGTRARDNPILSIDKSFNILYWLFGIVYFYYFIRFLKKKVGQKYNYT